VEAPAIVELGPYLRARAIRHAGLGLSWTVLAELEDWTTPRYYDAVGTPALTKRFRVRVTGPLPGRPSRDGETTRVVLDFDARRHVAIMLNASSDVGGLAWTPGDLGALLGTAEIRMVFIWRPEARRILLFRLSTCR
jgi:hypothetical protein